MAFLWLQLDQNIYREDSRGTATSAVGGTRNSVHNFTEGDEIKAVYIIKNGKAEKADYISKRYPHADQAKRYPALQAALKSK